MKFYAPHRTLAYICSEFRPLRQICSPATPVNFTRLRALCLATASFRRAPGFKTEYDRFKFHGTICKPYDPKEMRAHHLLNFTTRLANGVRNRALFCALKFYRAVHGAFKFNRSCKACKFHCPYNALQILARRKRGFKFKRISCPQTQRKSKI